LPSVKFINFSYASFSSTEEMNEKASTCLDNMPPAYKSFPLHSSTAESRPSTH